MTGKGEQPVGHVVFPRDMQLPSVGFFLPGMYNGGRKGQGELNVFIAEN